MKKNNNTAVSTKSASKTATKATSKAKKPAEKKAGTSLLEEAILSSVGKQIVLSEERQKELDTISERDAQRIRDGLALQMRKDELKEMLASYEASEKLLVTNSINFYDKRARMLCDRVRTVYKAKNAKEVLNIRYRALKKEAEKTDCNFDDALRVIYNVETLKKDMRLAKSGLAKESEADKTFKNALKNGCDKENALRGWFLSYNVDIDPSGTFWNYLMKEISFNKSNKLKDQYKDKSYTSANGKLALDTLYSVLADAMKAKNIMRIERDTVPCDIRFYFETLQKDSGIKYTAYDVPTIWQDINPCFADGYKEGLEVELKRIELELTKQ